MKWRVTSDEIRKDWTESEQGECLRHNQCLLHAFRFNFTFNCWLSEMNTTQWSYYNSKYIDAEEKDVSRNQIDESIEWFDENEVVDSARYTMYCYNTFIQLITFREVNESMNWSKWNVSNEWTSIKFHLISFVHAAMKRGMLCSLCVNFIDCLHSFHWMKLNQLKFIAHSSLRHVNQSISFHHSVWIEMIWFHCLHCAAPFSPFITFG